MTDRISRIAELNDRCRQGRDPGARIVITASCLAMLAAGGGLEAELRVQAEIFVAIQHYRFGADDDPEHRRGEVLISDHPVRFVIDYYDRSLEWGSQDPSDPEVTTRVMTIMLPEDD